MVYRHFPLITIHGNALGAAEASEAAGAQGKFWEYHDLLYERQAAWSNLDGLAAVDYFVALAEELDLDSSAFRGALERHTYRARVNAMRQESLDLGFSGTPTAFVNGEYMANGVPVDYQVWEDFVTTTIALEALAARQYAAAPEMTIDPEARYLATVTMDSGEQFVIELLPKSAPQTVNSFVFLAREGWFDGVTFHRVLPGFVAQTGDPTGTGLGGPGYTVPNEIDPSLTQAEPGMVAMANSGPDTNGSQWYVTLGDAAFLDGGYTIFGRVIEGLGVVEGLAPRDPQSGPGLPPGDEILSIEVEEIPAP